GTYIFTVTLKDASNLTAISSATVNVVFANASFVKDDATTQGTWTGVYGADGYDISQGAASLPSYASVTLFGNSNFVWDGSTTDPRALVNPGAGGRLAACWYTPPGSSFAIDVNLTDGQTHQ